MRFLFITERAGGAQEHVRCRNVATALLRAGHSVALDSGLYRPPSRDPRIRDPRKSLGGVPDWVILRMVADPRSVHLISEARAAGQHFAFDIDDNLWQIPEWSPAAATSDSSAPERAEAVMSVCDVVLAATEGIAELVRERVETPVRVVRNCLDTAAYRPHLTDHQPLRIGWPGDVSYRGPDLAYIRPPLVEFLDAHRGEVELWHLGASPRSLDISVVLGEDVPVVRRPWVPYERLSDSYSEIDAAIIPLAPVPFNLTRSANTGLTLAASGVPFVASATPEYALLSAQGAGFTVEDSWPLALEHLLDAEWRAWSSWEGRKTIAREYDVRTSAARWLAVFEESRAQAAPA